MCVGVTIPLETHDLMQLTSAPPVLSHLPFGNACTQHFKITAKIYVFEFVKTKMYARKRNGLIQAYKSDNDAKKGN